MDAEKLLNFYLDWVLTLPISLTEDSPRRWLRILGMASTFPWFVLLALFGPLTLGTAVVLVIVRCVQAAWREP